jgi:uncharacterized protein YjbI with pentapeptide repeats
MLDTVNRALAFLQRSLLFAWRRVAAARRTVEVSQEDQMTDRFTQAIKQLGSEELETRLGGIYALERIAGDSEKDYWPVMEVLTAYLRENARWQEVQSQAPPRFPTDIQAILTVLRRHARAYEKGKGQGLDLGRTDIQGAVLVGAHLEEANLSEAHLEEALLVGAYLERADLSQAHLERAHLRGAHLEEADLTTAHLQGAHLRGAHLQKADLTAARLERADLTAAHLEGADLTAAHLEGANLKGAHLEKADLTAAHLTDAVGLTRKQIGAAFIDDRTLLPDYLEVPAQVKEESQ